MFSVPALPWQEKGAMNEQKKEDESRHTPY